MRKDESGALWYSPTDLIRFVESPYASFMDRCYLEDPDSLTPDEDDPLLQLLMEKGDKHELSHLAELQAAGKDVAEIDDGEGAFERTLAEIQRRRAVIYQACLQSKPFFGFADFLEWSDEREEYEVWDTKLAASVKRYYLIQLCCYAEMIEHLVGRRPSKIGVVLGTGEAVSYRTDDFFYYYLRVKQGFLDLMAEWDSRNDFLPDVRADHGRWTSHAKVRLDEADHLVRVASITRGQIEAHVAPTPNGHDGAARERRR